MSSVPLTEIEETRSVLLLDDAVTLTPPHKRIGRYRVLEQRATGRHAEILLGEDGTRAVAIKRLLPRYARNAAVVDAFIEEAYWLSHAQHPNVIGVYEIGDDEGAPYLVLDYVHGASLKQLFVAAALDRTRLPIDACVAAIVQACAGAHALHDAGVIHGDLAPHDLLAGFDGCVKLIDCGGRNTIDVERRTTRAGYLAPEVIRGDAIDHRADVFSLGVIAWELFVERRATRRESVEQIFEATLNGDRPALRALRPEIPADIASIIESALCVDRDARPESARMLAQALLSALPTDSCALSTAISMHIGDAVLEVESVDADAILPVDPAGVHGSLDDLSLVEMIQAVELSGRSAEVQVSVDGEAVGLIGIHERHVVCAACGDLRGPEAFNALIGVRDGRFLLRRQEPRHELRHMKAPVELLLLDAMRAIDEQHLSPPTLSALPDHFRLADDNADPEALLVRVMEQARAAQFEAKLMKEIARDEIARARCETKSRAVAAAFAGVRAAGGKPPPYRA